MAKGNGANVPWEPTVLSWSGRDYTISAAATLGAICVVEDHITLLELVIADSSGRPPLGKISKAYGALLRYAGARVTDEEVYSTMFGTLAPGPAGDETPVQAALGAIRMLQLFMMPPEMRAQAQKGGEVAPANPTSPAEGTETGTG